MAAPCIRPGSRRRRGNGIDLVAMLLAGPGQALALVIHARAPGLGDWLAGMERAVQARPAHHVADGPARAGRPPRGMAGEPPSTRPPAWTQNRNLIRSVPVQGQIRGTKLTGESYVGLDLAAMKHLGDGPDDTGFHPGIGGGLSVLAYRCAADGGCSIELEFGDPYPKTAALDHRTQ